MKRLFLLLAFFSVFLICSMSIIPSAQSNIVKEEMENRISSLKILKIDNSIISISILKKLFFLLVVINLIQTIIIIVNEAPYFHWGDSLIEIIRTAINLFLYSLIWPYWFQLSLLVYCIELIFD